MSKRTIGQPTGKDREFTKPNVEYRMKREKPEPFKGHEVKPARQSNWRRDGLTNHQRVTAQRSRKNG